MDGHVLLVLLGKPPVFVSEERPPVFTILGIKTTVKASPFEITVREPTNEAGLCYAYGPGIQVDASFTVRPPALCLD